MRKYNFLVFLFLFAAGSLSAQLVNNGGTITIQNNAKLVVQTDILNNTGTIINSGTIEVEGDFTNAATVTSNAASKVIFTGAANSDFDSGGSTFAIVENAKTASDVTLTSALLANEQVDFSGTSNIVLGDHDLTLADAATSNGTAATGHFATTGLGNVVKMTDAAGTFTFDVGDGTNYTPLEAVHSGTYVAGTSSVSARVDDTDHPDVLADADNTISRYWTVENNLTSPSIDMTGTYVAADVTGTAADMVGARWENVDWEFGTGAQSGSTVSATTTEATSELTGMNFYGKADLKVFLDGPYDDATQTMSTTLNDNDDLPTTSPYGDGATVSAGFFNVAGNEDIVDWIYLEIRDAAGTISGGSAAFLESDGDIVGLDGTSSPTIKDALANGYVIVKHRNHNAVSTGTSIALDGSAALQDLSSSAYTAYGSNDRKLYAGTSKAAMWAGDAFNNGNVKYLGSSNDAVEVRNAVLADPGNFFNILTYTISSTYSDLDVNLDGDIKYLGADNDAVIIRNSVLDSPANFFNILTFELLPVIPQ